MSIFVSTAPMKDYAASIDISSAPPSNTEYGMVIDAFTMSFSGGDQQIGSLKAELPAQGLADDNKTLRSIMFFQLAKSGGPHADVTANVLGLTSAPSDLTFISQAVVSSGSQVNCPLSNVSYAYPALTQFDVGISNDTVSSIVYDSGLQNDGVPYNGAIAWVPTFTVNSTGGSGSFVVIAIPNGSSVPAAVTATWSPAGPPMMTVTFSNLPVAVSSAAILIDSFHFSFADSDDHNILDLALSAGNDTAIVTCTQNGSTYDATVRFVPEMMMRDASGHQLGNSSSIGFRVLVFPGTPLQTQG